MYHCIKRLLFQTVKKKERKKGRKEKERIDNYLTKLISLKKYSTGTEDINPITDRLAFEEGGGAKYTVRNQNSVVPLKNMNTEGTKSC